MDVEEEPRLTPPDAAQVAKRGLILAAVTCRGHIESGLNDATAQALHPRILTWLDACGLAEALEPLERSIIMAPLGSLTKQQQIDASWVVEGAAILAWALGKYPLPPHDARVDPFRVAEVLGFLWEDAVNSIRFAQLRGREQLNAYRELIYAIHCRLRQWETQPRRDDLDHWFQPTWLRALGLTRSSPLVEGDLALAGEPLGRLDAGTIREAEEVTRERHRAAIWLVGEQSEFWTLTTDT